MTYQPHYISAFEEDSGVQTSREPFILPEKAFPILEDAYVWRGKVKRREGFTHLGRLRRILAAANMGNITAAGAGTVVVNIFTGMGLLATEPYAQLQPGDIGAPISINIAGGSSIIDTVGDGTTTVAGPAPITSATINYNTGNLTIVFSAPFGPAAATFSGAYYPSLPVMGLRLKENDSINEEDLVAFDTKYAYLYSVGNFIELPSTTPTTWAGTDWEFFWTINYFRDPNYKKLFWATNFSSTPGNPIRYYNGTTWTNFSMAVAADSIANPSSLVGCRILLPFKGRFLAMNTIETIPGDVTTQTHYNRIRWCQNGSPLQTGVIIANTAVPPVPPFVWKYDAVTKRLLANAWASDIPGFGGWIDLPTAEQIVTAEFIKDVLLIKCERSSYKLIYTGIPSTPFIFEKINTELGAESTFSQIPFDKGVLTVGSTGITVDDSVNVTRIDVKIPDFVFKINNDNHGTHRVYGIRDFVNELAIWTYPNSAESPTYPNKLVIFNYENKSFSYFNDSFTCLGYFQRPTDMTWITCPYKTWAEWYDYWDSGATESWHPSVVGGNQQGYVSVLFNNNSSDISLSIKYIDCTVDPIRLIVLDHNLKDDMFVKVTDIISSVGPPDYSVELNDKIFKIAVVDSNTIELIGKTLAVGGDYIGEGHITVKNNFNITTKIFAPFYEQGSQARLGYIDFIISKTSEGQVTSNVYIDECNSLSQNDNSITSGNVGSNILLTCPENLTLIPYQANQDKIVHRQYVQSICQNFQIKLSMSDDQMLDKDIVDENFILHAVVFYLSKNARLVQ